jgi:hypothetical protein
LLFDTGRFALFFAVVLAANWLLGKRWRAQNVL